jgi:acetyl esterase/lipase
MKSVSTAVIVLNDRSETVIGQAKRTTSAKGRWRQVRVDIERWRVMTIPNAKSLGAKNKEAAGPEGAAAEEGIAQLMVRSAATEDGRETTAMRVTRDAHASIRNARSAPAQLHVHGGCHRFRLV